jgi:DNA-binding CsgD family transcriptional regulator
MALLSPRQRQCLALVALSRSNAEIAAALGVGVSTVKNHLSEAYRRLGVQNRTGAVVAMWREGAG